MRQALRAIWNARAERERQIVAAGALLLVVAALWAYVWSPLQADRARLRTEVPRLRAEAALVATGAAEVTRLRGALQAIAPGSGTTLIETRAREYFVAAYGGVTPLGDERYRLSLQPVPFASLTRFLGVLAADHAIVVETLALAAHADGGTVNVEGLVLRAPRKP